MIGVLAALAAGYALGARSGRGAGDELRRSLRALLDTDEMADVATAVRAEVGSGLRALAAALDGGDGATPGQGPPDPGDLVARVTTLVGGPRPERG